MSRCPPAVNIDGIPGKEDVKSCKKYNKNNGLKRT